MKWILTYGIGGINYKILGLKRGGEIIRGGEGLITKTNFQTEAY